MKWIMKKILGLSFLLILALNMRMYATSVSNTDNNVKIVLDNLFSDIKNLKFDSINQYVDNGEKTNIANLFKPISEFTSDFPASKEYLIDILSKINYDVRDIQNYDDGKKVKINFSIPDLKKVLEECKVEMIVKNAIRFVSNGFKLNNEILVSCIEIINKRLNKNDDYHKVNFDYIFYVKKINGEYKLQNVSSIYRDIESILTNEISNVISEMIWKIE